MLGHMFPPVALLVGNTHDPLLRRSYKVWGTKNFKMGHSLTVSNLVTATLPRLQAGLLLSLSHQANMGVLHSVGKWNLTGKDTGLP